MGKNNRHSKNLKAEKAKVKLKTKKVKPLTKGLNVTDTSFKVKQIIIRDQKRHRDETEILSKRKLNIKDLLSRLQHYNSSVRQETVQELKSILTHHSTEVLSSQLSSLLEGVSVLFLDKEKDVRRDSFKVLNLILSPISNEQLVPFCDVLIAYLRCAMTHIDPRIKEDSLMLLDVLMQNCTKILAQNSHRILPNFLDMISRLHTETKPGRQLMTLINSKNTSVKWRIKVLERLANMFNSIVTYHKHWIGQDFNKSLKIVHVENCTKYVPISNNNIVHACEINSLRDNAVENYSEGTLDTVELRKYVKLLMPLMFDSWIEVCSMEKPMDCAELIISNEASVLLKSIANIIQSITECIDMFQADNDAAIRSWFCQQYIHSYNKALFSKFPYSKSPMIDRTSKRQQDFSTIKYTDTCVEHNLALCQIYIWFTCGQNHEIAMYKLNKDYCTFILEYLNDKIRDWSNVDSEALIQLIKVLRILFLKASKFWYANHITLGTLLGTIIDASFRHSRKELHSPLFTILNEIVLDHTLIELHSEHVFKEFVATLPSLLLKPKVHENTIYMINKVVLRYTTWIKNELVACHDAIIENAKKIEIVGSEDSVRSRLAICNLFYFLDGQIYY
ncbi:hypothetical protein KM043_011348 [Ampulex compressa]|nr:hypothetical protein KM043_011348 [Ampulex compressa]